MDNLGVVLWLVMLLSNTLDHAHSGLVKRTPKRGLFGKTEIIQGDILIRRLPLWYKPFYDRHQSQAKSGTHLLQGVASAEPFALWPDGIVPFEIAPSLRKHWCLIEAAMLHIELNSCITFTPRQPNVHKWHLYIFENDGCYAEIGRDEFFRIGEVSLGEGCLHFGTVVHELMHALGFEHEHMRSDRDQFLVIHPENLDSKDVETMDQFERLDADNEIQLSTFDIESIMLYDPRAFSINGNVTVESKIPGVTIKPDSERQTLSSLDIVSLNKLYKCGKTKNWSCYKRSQALAHSKRCPRERKYLKPEVLKKAKEACKLEKRSDQDRCHFSHGFIMCL